MHRLIYLIITLMVGFQLFADRKNSIRPRLKVAPADVVNEPALLDTIVADSGVVRFSGYEKTLRSNRETFFVTSLVDREIAAVGFRISYFDSSGRLLHKVSHRKYVAIPPGETRRIDIPSWDKQFTFYYAGSPVPRVSAIPYNITISSDTVIVLR